MLALWNHMDDLLNDEFFRRAQPRVASFTPPVDIVETDKGYRLTADLPGMTAEDVDITIEDGVLTLSGERKSEKVEEGKGFRRVERSSGSFRRSFSLPKGVDVNQVTAHAENGQLIIEVPKPVSEIPRKIKVAAKPLAAATEAH